MSAEEEEMKEMVGGCCVCSDERGWDENPLVYCDGQGCNVAVHQACYGIVTVPSGPWFCRKCESLERPTRVRCELCPSKDGALKRTDQNGWAHVVCALYIPEVRFGNVTTMEPILISLIPPERFNKTCCICEDHSRGSKAAIGACMQCNKQGCKQNFHVTCAQMQGLLCEEAGNMDNVKYCGYCQHHYGKLMKNYNSMLNSSQKSTRNVKIIPPFRPVPAITSTESPSSSPEKPGGKTGNSSLNDDNKNSERISASTPSNNSTDNAAGGKSQANNAISISPDINSCSKSSKNSKKGSSGHTGVSIKSSVDSSMCSKVGTTSIIPKIAQPILTPATFSSTGPTKILSSVDEKSESTSHVKGRGPPHGKPVEVEQTSPVKCDDNLMIKLERVDEKNSPLKGTIHGRKDLTTLELKEVVTAALDRPMTSTASKFDHVSSTLTSGIEPPMSSIGSTGSASSHSSRHSHGEKPAPPDIKPHVTLTPIPMRGSTTRMSLIRAEEAREEREKESKSKDKSPVGTPSFHNSFGPPKLQSQNQQSSPDAVDSTGKVAKPPDLSHQNELPPLDKIGPPTKRARGPSREEDRNERKTPTKGRGGRRGATNANYNSKKEVTNGVFLDENSHDDPMEGTASSSNSTRGGRSGPGRKPGSSRISGRPPADDLPAPTLSQLKSQMEASGDSTLSALPPHMFGNALNPASSMAQRMVDTLSQEMEAVVAAGGVPDITGHPTPVIGISMPGKLNTNIPPVNGASTATVPHAPASAPPQTLEQLLERQWEQGSQFLMEQAQHLDIAQLLSCLNQLKQDNRALEEHVQSLVQRRDQLIAINARLSIPLGNNTTLAPLGTGFNSATNGNNHNGHGTPPPTLQPQTLLTSTGPKGLQISSSTLSPQQQHDMMMQHGRHGPRDDRIHPHSSEMQVSRAEIGAVHSSQNPHNHSHHPALNQRGQLGSSYGPYSGHSVPGATSHPSSHSHVPHHSSRDGSR